MLSRRQFTKNCFALSMLSAFPLLGGCRNGTLRLGYNPWIGYSSFNFIQEEGLIPPKVSLRQFSHTTATIHQLKNDHIDGGAFTLDEVLTLRSQGIPLTVVMIFDISAGADVVLTRDGRSIQPGYRVAYESSATGRLMFHLMMQYQHLDAKEVIEVPLPVNEHQ
ncbi:MAG: hypothetical protein JXK16_02855, partial [Thiotrichales bacterium]|nr:hypothetical protein [Thiotrichales bacterium]